MLTEKIIQVIDRATVACVASADITRLVVRVEAVLTFLSGIHTDIPLEDVP